MAHIPDVFSKNFDWSYTKAKAAQSCPRRYLLGNCIRARPTEKDPPMTAVGSFFHEVLDCYFDESKKFNKDYDRIFDCCIKRVKILGGLGQVKVPEINRSRLYHGGLGAIGYVHHYIEELKGLTSFIWYEHDFRINKKFQELTGTKATSMYRSLDTFFTGKVDLLGFNEATGDLYIADYKYYLSSDTDIHRDQLMCYNALVPAVLEDRGYKVKKIRNIVVMLRQMGVKEIDCMDYEESKLDCRQSLIDLTDSAFYAAEKTCKPARKIRASGTQQELIDYCRNAPTTPSESACVYCRYKTNCKGYWEHMKNGKES